MQKNQMQEDLESREDKPGGHKINAKTIARIAAIQTFYKVNYCEEEMPTAIAAEKILQMYKEKTIGANESGNKIKLKPSKKFFYELLTLMQEHDHDLEAEIAVYLKETWVIDNLPDLLKYLLKAAFCEMKFLEEVPTKVIINEYTDIAADILSENEIGFVNSILENYAKVARG